MMPRSLTMIVVMPIVGRIYNKVSPRLVIGFGILMFGWSAWLMGHYTLNTSARGVVNVLIIQGIAFSCLFIPLTTLALSSIPRHRLADATGLNSLLRQVGGSIGLAIFATLLTRSTTQARADMLRHIAPGNLALAVTKLPLRMIDLVVRQQAMVLAFEKLFYLAGISFLAVLPLVFLLRAPKTHEKIEVHLEM